MKIVIINGSARKGNTLTAINAFIKGASEKNEIEIIEPDKLNIAPCKDPRVVFGAAEIFDGVQPKCCRSARRGVCQDPGCRASFGADGRVLRKPSLARLYLHDNCGGEQLLHRAVQETLRIGIHGSRSPYRY